MSTTLQQFKDEVLGIFADLTRLTTYQQELLAKIAAGGMSPDDEASALAEVHSVAQKMKEAVASIPAPPVEEEPPVIVPPVEEVPVDETPVDPTTRVNPVGPQ